MVGRTREIKELNRIYNSHKPELLAIYGRRRIGKTYLVDHVFKNKITFRHAGISPSDDGEKNSMNRQLDHFYLSLQIQGMKKNKKPKNCILRRVVATGAFASGHSAPSVASVNRPLFSRS